MELRIPMKELVSAQILDINLWFESKLIEAGFDLEKTIARYEDPLRLEIVFKQGVEGE